MQDEQVVEIATEFGSIVLMGRDVGSAITLLTITRTLAPPGYFRRLPEVLHGVNCWRTHLPRNSAPPLIEDSVDVYAAAIDAAIASHFGAKPLVVAGISAGGTVALALRGPTVKRLVIVEPVIRTKDVWPLARIGFDAPESEPFLWAVLGLGRAGCELRDYTDVLAALDRPALVLVGDLALHPQRALDRVPSLLDDDLRRLLRDHPNVDLRLVEDAGHDIPADAPQAIVEAFAEACRGALRA